MKKPPLRIGTWLSVGSPVIAELTAECGFDWTLLDLEHGCESEAALPGQLRALRGSKTKAIVRVGAPHADLIARILDWGADGIMVPHVNSAEDAAAIVQAAHYPPRGTRGFSRTVRAYAYGLRPPQKNPRPPLLIAQIETLEAVNRAEEIAAVPGINVLFVGPADLNFDLRTRRSKVPYDECLHRVATAATAQRKASGILVRDLSDLPGLKRLGFTTIAISSDLSLLREGFLKILGTARD